MLKRHNRGLKLCDERIDSKLGSKSDLVLRHKYKNNIGLATI